MKEIQAWSEKVSANIGKAIFGKEILIKQMLSALLARGHVLLDDVPGLGKTMLSRALAASIGVKLSRIQSTPDLMPSDIIGVSIYNPGDGSFKFRKGPIMANLILVDEINRATPRTQSALLEAMAEQQVTVEGKPLPLPQPFFLMATQNPVDFEGTFPLPEAQKDRFLLTLSVGYPDREVERQILRQHSALVSPLESIKAVSDLEELVRLQALVPQIHVAESIVDYIIKLGEATRINQNLRMGISPRGTLSLYQLSQAWAAVEGRDYVIPEDVRNLLVPAFISRIILRPAALVKGMDGRQILETILSEIPAPLLSEVHKD